MIYQAQGLVLALGQPDAGYTPRRAGDRVHGLLLRERCAVWNDPVAHGENVEVVLPESTGMHV